MCEQLTTHRACRTCKQHKSKIIKNTNCDKVSMFKLGQCVNGMSYRKEVEHIECPDCEIKRITEIEADRKRRFLAAWPEPEEESDHGEKDEVKSEGGASVETEAMTITSEESWKMI
ncbi:hypothetical protein F53441_14222 [Fusarium austroafricanum]|uniref:Uncharacterized protein n=1 Tax=Fusarium austroafricanum TaxID=2364996 RepID=A0A8H4NFZ3_9HYPO|nr:hypothetical protein F53441_14222 [Fusarium austroafricanum]